MLDAAQPRQTWHFGLPCCSFSIPQHSNGGTRRKDMPQGDGSLPREILGNELLRRTMVLIKTLERAGNFWTLASLGLPCGSMRRFGYQGGWVGFVVGALLGYCFVAGLTPLPNNNLNKQIPVFNLQSVAKFLWNHFLDAFLSLLKFYSTWTSTEVTCGFYCDCQCLSNIQF